MIGWLARQLAREMGEQLQAQGEKRGSVEDPSVPISAAHGLWWGGANTPAGVTVNEQNALTLSTVFACVQLIGGTMGTLPLGMYRRDGDALVPDPDHPLSELLGLAPNPYMTATVWVETTQSHVLTWGNGYGLIRRDGRGRPVRVTPVTPDKVSRPRLTNAGALVYDVRLQDGTQEVWPDEDMLHIPGLGFDGLEGYSVVRHAARSMGLSIAAEDYGSRFFSNDARPNVVIEHPGQLGPEAHANLVRSIEERHSGSQNSHRPMVLEEGAKLETVGIPPEEAQFLETRRFQVTDVCRWFNVPPFMVGETEKSTAWGTGLEQITRGFIAFTLRRWLVRWEKELKRKLAPDDDGVPAFDLDALAVGDFAQRAEGWLKLTGRPIMTVDEARARENLPAMGGEAAELAEPLNQTTGGQPATTD